MCDLSVGGFRLTVYTLAKCMEVQQDFYQKLNFFKGQNVINESNLFHLKSYADLALIRNGKLKFVDCYNYF